MRIAIKYKIGFLFIVCLFLLSFISAFSNSITGNVIFPTNPNELQIIYSESIPSVSKINVYYSYDIFLPKLKRIDFKNNFDFEYPFYEDLNVRKDDNINGFDDFFGDSFWDDYYVGEYYFLDELGELYIEDMTKEDIDDIREEFNDYHDSKLPFITGTGFVISSDGHVLTNAHVVTIVEEEMDSLIENVIFSNYLNYYYFLYENAEYNEDISMNEYEEYIKKYLFLAENLEITNLKVSKIEVIIGEGLDAKTYEADLVDYNEEYLNEIGGRDWALLKINGSNFQSLELGDSDLVPIGEDIVVIGYPWTSEGFSEDYFNNVAATPTYGKVSNLVPMGEYRDIQIDLSIEGGNSGGPGINSEGKVIGIATSGYDSLGGTYNYLTPINDVVKELNIDLVEGDINKIWNSGLENFWNKNYINAKADFEMIIEKNPDHPYVQHVLNQLKSFPETNAEELNDSNIPNKEKDGKSNLILIIIGIIVIFLLGFIAIGIYRSNHKKK